MKKFSLKKVTAAVSTAAMIASMGTMAFADEFDNGLKVSDVTPAGAASGVYTYEIDYSAIEGGISNENGVSLLVYGATSAEGDGVNNWTADESGYVDTKMQILGVDQNAKGASDKKFTVVLTTNDTDSNGYHFKEGKPVIVAVNAGGDVKYAKIERNATATAQDVLVDGVSLVDGKLDFGPDESNKAENGTEAKVKETAKNAVEAKFINAAGVSVSDLVVGTYDKNDLTVSVTFKATVAKDTVFTGGTEAEQTDFKVANDIVINGTVKVHYTVVEATEITNSGVTMTESELNGADDAEAKVKELLEAKKDVKVTLKNDDVTDEVTLDFTDSTGNATVGDITAETITAENGNDKVYTVPVTVKAGTTGAKGIVKVGGEDKAVDVKVTVTAKKVINGINGFTLGTTATISDKSQWNVEGIAGAALAQLAAPNGVAVSVNDVAVDQVKVELKDLTLTTTLNPATITEDTTSVAVTIKATALTGSSLVDTHCIDPNGVELGTVTVNFQAYKLGDVNADGSITAADYTSIKKYVLKKISNFTDKDGAIIPKEAGDVNGDTNITAADYTLVKKYVLKKITSFPAEENK